MDRRSAATEQAADRRHQLLGLLVAAPVRRAHHAVFRVVLEQLERDLVERRLDRGDLGDDVDAVTVLLDHPVDPADLALDPAQAPFDPVLVLGGAAGLGKPIASPSRTARPKRKATAVTTPTILGSGTPWMPVSWTAVWPFPRPISQRLTGTVRTKAIARANARLPQNRSVSSPASMAPGMTRRMMLSTTSIVAIDSVSEARAIGTTAPIPRPARSSGRLVRK